MARYSTSTFCSTWPVTLFYLPALLQWVLLMCMPRSCHSRPHRRYRARTTVWMCDHCLTLCRRLALTIWQALFWSTRKPPQGQGLWHYHTCSTAPGPIKQPMGPRDYLHEVPGLPRSTQPPRPLPRPFPLPYPLLGGAARVRSPGSTVADQALAYVSRRRFCG